MCLRKLESESIYIIREAVAEAENPVMLYSVGKDSAVMTHLAIKAFAPNPLPFPLLHVDTTFKFKEMYEFRDRYIKDNNLKLIVHINNEDLSRIGPYKNWNCSMCASLLKTKALLDALSKYKFDIALGGARRDEERSRAKERIMSFRDIHAQWNPKQQRPEFWNIYNLHKNKKESFRAFPISNWTELNVWEYIKQENIDIVPLYFSKIRPVINRNGILVLAGEQNHPTDTEKIEHLKVRFRTLGCQKCTGAIESDADNLDKIIDEIKNSNFSERQNRVVDQNKDGSMEDKKRSGYF